MLQNLEEDESILNFAFLTAAFYKFFTISSKNFEQINLKEKECMIEKEFEDLNMNNLLDYLGFLSDITKNDEISVQKKKDLFQTVFKIEFNEKDKEKIFYESCKKMDINTLNNKNELVKLLNQYIINFNFEIYQLFYLIIKKMEKTQKEIIEEMTIKNLLEVDEIRKEKSSKEKELLIENKKLKSKIKNFNKNEESIKNMEAKNRKLNDELSNLKENFKKLKIENEKEVFKLKEDMENKLSESIKNLKLENEKEAKKKENEINKLNESIKSFDKETIKLKENIKNMKIENENFKIQLAALIEEKEEQKKRKLEERYENIKNLNIEIILAETSYHEVFDTYREKIVNLIKENQCLDLQNLELKIDKQKNEAEIQRLQNLLKFYDLEPEVQKKLKERKNLP